MSEVIVAMVGAIAGFLFGWWRERDVAGLESKLAEQTQKNAELLQMQNRSYGEFWKLTGELNLFGPTDGADLTELSAKFAKWYYESGETLGEDFKHHFFIVQEFLGLCRLQELKTSRPSDERILGSLDLVEGTAISRLDDMRELAFGDAAKAISKDKNRIATVDQLRALFNTWRREPQGGKNFTAEEKAWLLLQWLLSLLRSRVRVRLADLS